MRPCFLLDVHIRLGKGETGMSALSAACFGAACSASKGVMVVLDNEDEKRVVYYQCLQESFSGRALLPLQL